MSRIFRFACGLFLPLYLLVYAFLYHFRGPAANLAYWVYSESTPDWAEVSLYYAFYPPYFVHQRLFAGARHNYDRPEPWFPPAYEW